MTMVYKRIVSLKLPYFKRKVSQFNWVGVVNNNRVISILEKLREELDVYDKILNGRIEIGLMELFSRKIDQVLVEIDPQKPLRETCHKTKIYNWCITIKVFLRKTNFCYKQISCDKLFSSQ